MTRFAITHVPGKEVYTADTNASIDTLNLQELAHQSPPGKRRYLQESTIGGPQVLPRKVASQRERLITQKLHDGHQGMVRCRLRAKSSVLWPSSSLRTSMPVQYVPLETLHTFIAGTVEKGNSGLLFPTTSQSIINVLELCLCVSIMDAAKSICTPVASRECIRTTTYTHLLHNRHYRMP